MIQLIALHAIPLIFAITLHEAAHGYAALKFGDRSALEAGRISLNPAKHIDLVGTILVPLMILLFSQLGGGPGLLFGWAKPVPVNFGRLHHPKRDMLWVALSGPAANLFMAILWAIGLRLLTQLHIQEKFWLEMALVGIKVNLVLFALNLFPIPPLDGGRMMFSVLPHRWAWRLAQVEPYGMFIVVLLMFSGLLWIFLSPILMVSNIIIGWFL